MKNYRTGLHATRTPFYFQIAKNWYANFTHTLHFTWRRFWGKHTTTSIKDKKLARVIVAKVSQAKASALLQKKSNLNNRCW